MRKGKGIKLKVKVRVAGGHCVDQPPSRERRVDNKRDRPPRDTFLNPLWLFRRGGFFEVEMVEIVELETRRGSGIR